MDLKTDAQPKPRLALAIATALGIGYFLKAPGTWGSLAGALLYFLTQACFPLSTSSGAEPTVVQQAIWLAMTGLPVALILAAAGVWAAHRAAEFCGKKDPQFVVIDEVSGQHLTFFLSLAPLNWRYLLAGFILFRLFDIWKPFPIRRAEALPGGLGIMADDWLAGVYAALLLALARHFGL